MKDIKVYTFSGDDYFPLKDIAALYGSHLVWKPVSGKATLNMNNERFDIYIKSTKIVYGAVSKRLSLPTRYKGDVLCIPAVLIESADFFAFSQAETSWNPDSGILTIEHKATIAPPRYYSRGQSTRIVVEMLEDLPFVWSQGEREDIVLSFSRGRVHEGKINVGAALVKNIEMKNNGRLSTVTVHLASSTAIVDRKQIGSKIIIDIRAAASAQAPDIWISSDTAATLPVAADSEAVAVSSLAVAAPPPYSAARKRKLIVLDAGHGGDDPGAVGRNHTREKDVNLAIVNELKALFQNDEDGACDVVLTRTDDTFIPLVERTSLANEKKADLFVSIHCNADSPRSSSGFEIYFLSEKASDEEAAATAMLENAVVELEGRPTKKRARLQELLWSLVVNECINESSELCSLITNEVLHRVKIESRGVKQAGFYVLRGAEMPAVLVECAFLSNAREEARLRTKKFQVQIADAVYEGIKRYLSRKDVANARLRKENKSE